MSCKRWFLLLALLISTSIIFPHLNARAGSLADGVDSSGPVGTYSFGGGCSSLGAWSQQALAQANEIESIARKLQGNPDCKGIESIVSEIKNAQAALQISEGEENPVSRFESIPSELSSLRQYMTTDSSFLSKNPSLKSSIGQLIFSRSLEGAALGSELTMINGMRSLGKRAALAAQIGLPALESVFSTLPSYEKCLLGQPNQGLALVAASVKLAAAFTASGDGVASKMGNAIASLVSMLQKSHFSKAIRQINESEFWVSLSCLIETTTQAYCAADDAYVLVASARKGNYSLKGFSQKPGPEMNPIEGYVMLTREGPLVSDWLQKIILGARARLSNDAAFKNNVLDATNEFSKNINLARGDYNEGMLALQSITDASSQRNYVLKMIMNITNLLTRSEGGGNNFFTMTEFERKIPFYLIGRNEVPPELAGGGFMLTWDQYMQQGGRFVPEFQDPLRLAEQMGQRLESLFDRSSDKASAFYRQRMIVDMPNLVNEAFVSQTLSVVDSLRHIDSYLARLADRIRSQGTRDDAVLIPSIQDTRNRIRKVLTAKESILQQKVAPDGSASMKAYENLIDIAFKEFNVLLQRDTFFATRLTTFVRADYAMLIRDRNNLDKHQRELLLMSGRSLLEKISEAYGDNPNAVLQDLNQAQVVNKKNLAALEMLFSDSLVPIIEELDSIAKGERPTSAILRRKAIGRMIKDSFSGFSLRGTRVASSPSRRFFHPGLYPMRISLAPAISGADTEHGSFAQFKAKLCIQALAFEDREKFDSLCKDAVLKSAFTESSLDSSYAGYRKADLAREVKADGPCTWKNALNCIKPHTAASATTTSNICAFRDFKRRNLVYWLTQDLSEEEAEERR